MDVLQEGEAEVRGGTREMPRFRRVISDNMAQRRASDKQIIFRTLN